MDVEEYRRRYRARLISNGCLSGVADDVTDEAEPSDEDLAEADPEGDADNEMSYWDDE